MPDLALSADEWAFQQFNLPASIYGRWGRVVPHWLLTISEGQVFRTRFKEWNSSAVSIDGQRNRLQPPIEPPPHPLSAAAQTHPRRK